LCCSVVWLLRQRCVAGYYAVGLHRMRFRLHAWFVRSRCAADVVIRVLALLPPSDVGAWSGLPVLSRFMVSLISMGLSAHTPLTLAFFRRFPVRQTGVGVLRQAGGHTLVAASILARRLTYRQRGWAPFGERRTAGGADGFSFSGRCRAFSAAGTGASGWRAAHVPTCDPSWTAVRVLRQRDAPARVARRCYLSSFCRDIPLALFC